MINLYDGQITDILPEKIAKDTETRCLSFAIQKEHQRLIELTNTTRTMSVIDELPERILDVLAVELRTPYYQEDMDVATAGTPSAVAELIEIVFGEGSVVEWFDYEEPPYTPGTFDIITNAQMTEEMLAYFLQIIRRVKNTRSHIRKILVQRKMDMSVKVAAAVVSSPKIIIYNAPQTKSQIMAETKIAIGAVSRMKMSR